MNPIADFVAGALLLALGRKLFWLFVGIAGFYLGIEIVRTLLAGQPSWLMWVVAAGAGLVGALLAMLFQRVGFALAGFYAGGYLALVVAERFSPGAAGVTAFLIGSVAGGVFAALVMDWAIIVLSCVVGAALIVANLSLGGYVAVFVYALLVATGISVQAWLMRGTKGVAAKERGRDPY